MKKIYFASLGCDKNLVDAEHCLYALADEGYSFTDVPEEAQVIIVNSCCFIADAMEESINTILSLSRFKTEGSCQALLVMGCLAQRFSDEFQKELPEVDALVGTSAYDKLPAILRSVLDGKPEQAILSPSRTPLHKGRLRTGILPYAYLKIAEGCDKHCTYCIIPKIRGSYRSFPMEDLLAEAKQLVDSGVRELLLVAQETTMYGTDLYGKKSLVTLLQKLSEFPDLYWIRILYAYPEEITLELAQEIARNPKVCHYIDIPIQHCNDTILKQMGRRTNKKELEEKIALLRETIPDLCIRTTLISGFPGETEEQHQELLEFLQAQKFDRVGVFPYSKEEGTAAASFRFQIEDAVKNRRREELMQLQQEISLEKNRQLVSHVLPCLVEGRVGGDHGYAARSYRDAPDVDGLVFFDGEREYMSGEDVLLRVTGSNAYDLVASIQE